VLVPESKVYALSGGMFALIGIAAISRHEVLPGLVMFLVAIGCGLRAHNQWKHEQV
jgi:hypothetical protein